MFLDLTSNLMAWVALLDGWRIRSVPLCSHPTPPPFDLCISIHSHPPEQAQSVPLFSVNVFDYRGGSVLTPKKFQNGITGDVVQRFRSKAVD